MLTSRLYCPIEELSLNIGDRVIAPKYDFDQIKILSEKGLWRCCECNEAMIVKRGNRDRVNHFAHKVASQCPGSRGESADHENLKARIYQACIACGLEADIEHSGQGWRADVICMATPNVMDLHQLLKDEGVRRFVFEVQLSSQSYQTTVERTQAYAKEKIHCIWFFKNPPMGLTGAGYDFRTSTRLWFVAISGDAVSMDHWIYPGCPHSISISDFVEGYLIGELKQGRQKYPYWNQPRG